MGRGWGCARRRPIHETEARFGANRARVRPVRLPRRACQAVVDSPRAGLARRCRIAGTAIWVAGRAKRAAGWGLNFLARPLQFTPVAAGNEAAFRKLVAQVYEFRAALKSEALNSAVITIAAQHTLASSYLPAFLEQLQRESPEQSFRIRSDNRADSVAVLMRGQAEILITYETPQSPCGVPAQMARRHVLGQDNMMLVASPALHRSL